MNFAHYILSRIPRFLDKCWPKTKKIIKLLVHGRIDLILLGIGKVFKNSIVGQSSSIALDISVVDISVIGIVILATPHTRYIGHLIQKALAEIDCHTILSDRFSEEQDHGQLHFVICPQMFAQLPRNFIAFQLEQSISSRWFTYEYFTILKKAYCIFEYSVKNIEFLTENKIPYQKIFYLPIGSFPGYTSYLKELGYSLSLREEKIEVLFYGDPNCERRQRYLERLKSVFDVHVASEIFGESLASLVCRAKVVVNIHYYDDALLETTRIHEALSLGTPIVSESSIDIQYYAELNEVISFVPIGDIEAMIREVHLLLKDDLQEQRKYTISQFIQHDRKFFDYFKRFLLSTDLFNYSLNDYAREVEFVHSSNNYTESRLCLTLTETPMRKSSFLAKNTHGFEMVEGLRYSPGWIGCGMSYKYMLEEMKKLGHEEVIICEDDVAFPDDIEHRISITRSYLKQTKHRWHIFAGLIADVHPDTKILHVEEYEGIEYIYIDKMTSMVMNIYSLEIMEIISLWDQTNKNVETNTIDRYIESHTDIIVVTTLPYLVGHTEDQSSTLWGGPNTQYSAMIDSSREILARKVCEYKSNLGLAPCHGVLEP